MKELFLVSRLLYSMLAAVILVLLTKIAWTMPWVTLLWFFALIAGSSLFIQYVSIHHVVKAMDDVRERRRFLIVWTLISVVFFGVGIISLVQINWLAEPHVITKNLFWGMFFFVIASAMFVAGTCTRRSFERHGAL